MPNIEQALALSDLGATRRPPMMLSDERIKKASQIAERVFAMAGEQGKQLAGTPASWRSGMLKSSRFFLLDLPVNLAACHYKAHDQNKVQGCMRAAADSVEPIVVDVNGNKLGMTPSRYYPPVVVIDGVYRHTAARMQGRETIRAWVGELAAQALGLFDKKKAPEKRTQEDDEYVELKAAAENTASNFRRYQVSSIEAAMWIFGAAGGAGMGGPGNSLSQGSGPSTAMKPMPLPGGKTAVPTLRSRGRRKLKGGGYFGYKDASKTEQRHMKAPKGSELEDKLAADVDINHKSVDLHERPPRVKNPAKKLESSGYFGYKDSTETDREHMRAPKKSELQDAKLRHPGNYTSEPDVEELNAARVARIVTDYKAAMRSGYRHSANELQAVAPPGGEHVVKALKRHFGEKSSSPFAIAWWLHNKQKRNKNA